MRAFTVAFHQMKVSIAAFVALPIDKLDPVALSIVLREIGRLEGAMPLREATTMTEPAIARAISDTYASTAPVSVPPFIAVRIIGMAAAGLLRCKANL
jgi:hypothetical protein